MDARFRAFNQPMEPAKMVYMAVGKDDIRDIFDAKSLPETIREKPLGPL
jgi:hypothetical protein